MQRKRLLSLFLPLLLAFTLLFTGCNLEGFFDDLSTLPLGGSSESSSASQGNYEESSSESESWPVEEGTFCEWNGIEIPAFSGDAYIPIHNNVPYFTKSEITATSFETYAPLDNLGRCGVTVASVGQDLMPTEDRGSIGQVKPTGWQTVKYDIVDGKYLYNRCHLIGFQLTGENANRQNLITGTRYLNIEGMLPFEKQVAAYVKETGNHVMYRVTPVFVGNELVARGVVIEGYSVEDEGEEISFCVFAYNVQPGIRINYKNGESMLWGDGEFEEDSSSDSTATDSEETFVLNTSSKKYHRETCSGVATMSPQNRQDYTGDREALEEQGYEPCGICKP